MDPDYRTIEELQQEVQEIADILLRQRPPGTDIIDVWQEALSLHRVRYDTEVRLEQRKHPQCTDEDSRPG